MTNQQIIVQADFIQIACRAAGQLWVFLRMSSSPAFVRETPKFIAYSLGWTTTPYLKRAIKVKRPGRGANGWQGERWRGRLGWGQQMPDFYLLLRISTSSKRMKIAMPYQHEQAFECLVALLSSPPTQDLTPEIARNIFKSSKNSTLSFFETNNTSAQITRESSSTTGLVTAFRVTENASWTCAIIPTTADVPPPDT